MSNKDPLIKRASTSKYVYHGKETFAGSLPSLIKKLERTRQPCKMSFSLLYQLPFQVKLARMKNTISRLPQKRQAAEVISDAFLSLI